jgi:hypothetical protein
MPGFNFEVQPRWIGNLFDHFGWQRCAQRVLVVTDGLSFDAADQFGLTVFLNELGKAYPAPTVTTWQRGPRLDGSVNIDNYDQIWLFGRSGDPQAKLTEDEVKTISTFMDAGGGVFATGDHQTLGQPMCGEIPRVRGMREWAATPMVIERIDTVTYPGDDADTTFNDQSDIYPQRIYPVFRNAGSWVPHPLLRANRVIDVLPDHPHESVCYGGASTTSQEDFPMIAGVPMLPEIVAYSVSAGRFVVDTGKPPTTPKMFGAISAYDGHQAGHGRIVCDATWHHFVNVNLDGTASGRLGLQTAPGVFTKDFEQIARYYRNILDWLTPASRRFCTWWIDIVLERYHYPLWEEFVPLPRPHPCPWEPRVALGRVVESALRARHGDGFTTEIAFEALKQIEATQFAELVEPHAIDGEPDIRRDTLINVAEFRYGIIGSIADALLADLPTNPDDVAGRDYDHNDAALRETIATAAREAIGAAARFYTEAATRTAQLF